MKPNILMSIVLTVLLNWAVAAPAAAEEVADEETAVEQAPEPAAAEQAPEEVTDEDTAVEQAPEEVAAADADGAARDDSGIEVLVVTAEKRETKIQDTPIAVTAMDQDYLKDQVINNANDYTLVVPSFSYREVPNRAFIRGVGRNVNALGLDPGVAIYNDGVYTSETAGLFGSSFGVERVEILRGPQGTLYGRSATGGAVNIISEKPSDEFEVKTRFVVGNLDQQEYGVIVTGPVPLPVLEDRLRYHYQFNRTERDGFIKNRFESGRDLGSLDAYFHRAALEADITNDLNV